MRGLRGGALAAGAVIVGSLVPLAVASASTGGHDALASITRAVQVSTCGGSNAEVEEALSGSNVYVEWIGCGGIGFARSTDGGRVFGPSITLPGSQNTSCSSSGCTNFSWDPAITVSRTGLVYATFMHRTDTLSAPVVDVSSDQGRTFPQSVSLPVPATSDPNGNWGDRDFVAVAPSGTVYVTWDYGPSASALKFVCSPIGSCSFTAGDLNAVLQTSTDGGKTWSAVAPISPHFPLGGADLAPILVQPNGTIDVLFQAFPTQATTDALSPGHEYFTRSRDGGATWSTPIKLGPSAGTVSLTEWWIDGALGTDSAGNLYATWDTQSAHHDIGWLVSSTKGGSQWSRPIRVTSPTIDTEQLVEPVGVGRGLADVAWQTPTPKGYATFVRTYSIAHGWLQPSALRVSPAFGNSSVWPGDTFGIAAVPGGRLGSHGSPIVLTWGSALRARTDQIYAATVAP